MSRKGFILVLILGVGVKGAYGELSGSHVLPYVVTLGLGALLILFTSYWSGRQRKKELTEPSPAQTKDTKAISIQAKDTEPTLTGTVQTEISQTEASQPSEGTVTPSSSETEIRVEVVGSSNTKEPSPIHAEVTEPTQTGPIQTEISQTEGSQTEGDTVTPSSPSQTELEVVDSANNKEPPTETATATQSATLPTPSPATATPPAAGSTTASHSKLSGDVTPTKDKKEPPAGAPESPQNKPAPSTSSPAPPPREERSAPEGTSSPSPRPSDTAERKSLSTRPTSAPPEGYMTASEVQELLKRQELKFEEKLLRVELAAGEKEKKLQQTMKDEQKEMATLGSSVAELTQSRDALLKMVSQYKGMLATLVTEKEKEKKSSDEKISSLQGERDQALEDLANVEVAFSDVHRKYERTKQVVDTLKRNEETLRGAVADYEAKLKKQEQKFLEFQKHAEEKIQMANEEFESMRKSNEQEMTKMAALLKKAEMKIMSLQDSFDRKTRENQELTQLCDDLINKVGTSH